MLWSNTVRVHSEDLFSQHSSRFNIKSKSYKDLAAFRNRQCSLWTINGTETQNDKWGRTYRPARLWGPKQADAARNLWSFWLMEIKCTSCGISTELCSLLETKTSYSSGKELKKKKKKKKKILYCIGQTKGIVYFTVHM